MKQSHSFGDDINRGHKCLSGQHLSEFDRERSDHVADHCIVHRACDYAVAIRAQQQQAHKSARTRHRTKRIYLPRTEHREPCNYAVHRYSCGAVAAVAEIAGRDKEPARACAHHVQTTEAAHVSAIIIIMAATRRHCLEERPPNPTEDDLSLPEMEYFLFEI